MRKANFAFAALVLLALTALGFAHGEPSRKFSD